MVMNTSLVTHVFASLQSLEKCLGNVKKMLPSQTDSCDELKKVVPEQEKILEQMRRIANKLQLEVARNDLGSAVRTLKIFYGLNHMIRGDVMNAFSKLSELQSVPFSKLATPGKEIVYH